MVLKFEHLGKQMGKSWRVPKCDAPEKVEEISWPDL